jgi:hypothetical protein
MSIITTNQLNVVREITKTSCVEYRAYNVATVGTYSYHEALEIKDSNINTAFCVSPAMAELSTSRRGF